MTDTMKLPLTGFRVLDWTAWQAGPVATGLLADLGAEVIKLEPLTGDPMRGHTRTRGMNMQLFTGTTPGFELFNRNKKSLALDLAKEESREVVRRLAKRSDVFVHNLRPEAVIKQGMDYKTLSRVNTRLVYASISGFGPKGSWANGPGFDPLGHAGSGMMYAIGDPESPPIHIPAGLADQITGTFLAYGVVVALLARERWGNGQQVNASLLASMMWVQANHFMSVLMLGQPLPKQSRAKAPSAVWNHYRCSDGKWLMIAGFQADRVWAPVCSALGLPALAEDPRLSDAEKRERHCEETVAAFDRAFATAPRHEWLRRLFGIVPCYPILNHNEVVGDEQVLANDYVIEFNHPALGPMKMLGSPFQLGNGPMHVEQPAPQVGQHTEEILIDVAGYTWEELGRLKDQRVIL